MTREDLTTTAGEKTEEIETSVRSDSGSRPRVRTDGAGVSGTRDV